jgi:hypothetical protein
VHQQQQGQQVQADADGDRLPVLAALTHRPAPTADRHRPHRRFTG